MKKNINIQEYIDSGILEQYALGLTTMEQNVEIAEILKQYPELQKEFAAIEGSLEFFAKQYAKPMPAYLKDRILRSIDNEKRTNNQSGNSGGKFMNYLMYIGIPVLAVSTFYFWKKQQENKKEFTELVTFHQSREQRYKQDSVWLIDCSNQLNDLRNKERFRILLKGTPKSPQSFAAVYYDTISRKSFIDVMDLPTPPQQKQYQLWAIVSGKPVSLGLVDLVNNRSLFAKAIEFVPDAQAFAITLEPLGGQNSPSLDQMYLMGGI